MTKKMDDSQSLLEAQEQPKVQKKVRFSNIVTVYREPTAHKFGDKQGNSYDLGKFTTEPILVPFQHKRFTKHDEDANTCSCASLGIMLILLFFVFIMIVVFIRRLLLIEMEQQAPQQSSLFMSTRWFFHKKMNICKSKKRYFGFPNHNCSF